MAIFDEQVLEPFVAKGIGNSGIASRQIQAGNLPDLSAAVRQSAMTQQNLQDQQSAALKALAIKNYKAPSIRSVASGGVQDLTKPFVLGRAGTGKPYAQVTVAIPDGRGGYKLRSESPDSPYLKDFGYDPNKTDYAELGITGLGGAYSGTDLSSLLLQYAKKGDISGILNRIQAGGLGSASGGGGGGRGKIPFAIAPNISDMKWEAEQQKKKVQEDYFSLRNAAAKIDDPVKRLAAQSRIGIKF